MRIKDICEGYDTVDYETVYMLYVDGVPKVKFTDKNEAIDTYLDFKRKFLKQKVELKQETRARQIY